MLYSVCQMSNPEQMDDKGVLTIPSDTKLVFEVPVNKTGGSRHDMGALVLFLVTNWFVNRETVLIDGGVEYVFCLYVALFLFLYDARLSSGTHRRTDPPHVSGS